MSIQPSASKSALLLQCQYAFSPDIDVEPDDGSREARYGSAWHEVMAKVITACITDDAATRAPGYKPVKPAQYDSWVFQACKTWKAERDAHDMAYHVWEGFKVLRKWLAGDNPWGKNFLDGSRVRAEVPYAFKPDSSGSYIASELAEGPSVEGHVYEGVKKGWIPGTLDLQIDVEAGDDSLTLILDHKTGSSKDFTQPDEDAQLRTLSMVGPEDEDPVVAIFHTPVGTAPMIYAEELKKSKRAEHSRSLRKAMRRIGDGSLRPGPWCVSERCPARSVCPAQYANIVPRAVAIVESGGGLVKAMDGTLTTAADVGRFHQLSGEMKAVMRMADKEVRAWVTEHPEVIVTRPDGGTLEFEERTYETLSKEHIFETLGKVAGERFIEGLRKKGLVKKSPRLELRVIRDKG